MGYRSLRGIGGGGAFDKARRVAARIRVETGPDRTMRAVPAEPAGEPSGKSTPESTGGPTGEGRPAPGRPEPGAQD
jgi:hypothetical protein